MINLEENFAEIENRVKSLLAENHSQRKRIRELEAELEKTRNDAQASVQFHDKQLQLRQRIEKILLGLESIESRKRPPD